MTLGHSLLSGLVLAASVAGHPASNHAHKRAHQHASHGGVTIYDESVATPTVVPERVVWVDDADKPLCTATENVVVLPAKFAGASTQEENVTSTVTCMSTETVQVVPLAATGAPNVALQAPVAAEAQAGAPVHPVIMGEPPSSPLAVPRPQGAVVPPEATGGGEAPGDTIHDSAASNGGDSGSSSPAAARFPGVSYTPYRADHQCKTKEQVQDDFDRFVDPYSMVRVYGTDCDQVATVYEAAKAANNTKLFLGIWDINQIPEEANKIITGTGSDWDMVHTVSVGNELVNNGQATPEQVVGAVKQARKILRDAGYKGPVVTVDTFMATEAHPELCEQSDYCAINAHAFFDSTISAEKAGPWLADTVKRVKSKLSSPKEVIVTETGWPTKGASNGLAVPSMANQKAALASINEAFSDNLDHVVFFSAFNDLWKQQNMATFNADQFWGIHGAVSSCDQ